MEHAKKLMDNFTFEDQDELEFLLQKCEKLEKHLCEVERLKEMIKSLNREKVAEITSYSKPSEITVSVLKSVLYLQSFRGRKNSKEKLSIFFF